MRKFHPVRTVVLLSSLLGSGIVLHAEPAPTPQPQETPDVTVPIKKDAQLTPEQMETKARELAIQATEDRNHISELRAAARKKKDIIKINCINDKLLQVKQLLNIMDDALSRLTVAIANNDDPDRYHRFAVVTISSEKVRVLRDEAEACIGEEISYLGPLDVDVQEPAVPDDPTVKDPFGNDEIEPPGYASPFF